MKTTLKIIAWALSSFILIVLIAIAVSIWWVFTPEKITPLVQKQLQTMLTCETRFDRVELTFFSTFPEFTLHLHGFSMVQPVEGIARCKGARAFASHVANMALQQAGQGGWTALGLWAHWWASCGRHCGLGIRSTRCIQL